MPLAGTGYAVGSVATPRGSWRGWAQGRGCGGVFGLQREGEGDGDGGEGHRGALHDVSPLKGARWDEGESAVNCHFESGKARTQALEWHLAGGG